MGPPSSFFRPYLSPLSPRPSILRFTHRAKDNPVDETSNLLLPYILAAQAQKHVTHNEALRKLDALVQISVVDRDLAAPPASPAEGARYIIAASPDRCMDGSRR